MQGERESLKAGVQSLWLASSALHVPPPQHQLHKLPPMPPHPHPHPPTCTQPHLKVQYELLKMLA